MRLSDLLPAGHVRVPLHARDLAGALLELAAAAAGEGAVLDPDRLHGQLTEPDLRGAVAVGDDVALPHLRTDTVDRLVLAVGVSPTPLEPGATGVAARPRVVVLILAPPTHASLHLQAISTLARFLGRDDVLQRILQARSPDDVVAIAGEAEMRIQPRLTVRDVMGAVPGSVGPDDPLRAAIDVMARTGAPLLPVVGEKGDVLGTITDRDVLRALFPQVHRDGEEGARGAALRDTSVRDLMSRSVLCVSEGMGLDEVAAMLVNKDVAQIPVVVEGRLAGMLGRADIIRNLFGR